MSETLIPTMGLRFTLKPAPLMPGHPAVMEREMVLQQRFDRPSGGHVWRDVPLVVDGNQRPDQ